MSSPIMSGPSAGFNLSAYAISQPLVPLVAFSLLLVLGAIAWIRLPVQGNPSVSIPIVKVTISQDGATPDDLERQVAKPVEGALSGLSGARRVSTKLSSGSAEMTVEFLLDVPFERAVSDVRDAISITRPTLPAGIREPLIERIDMSGSVLLTYSVAAPGTSLVRLSWFVDDVVKRSVQSVPGVAVVRREGGVDREIRVELAADAIVHRGLSVARTDAAIRAAIVDQPGGIQVAHAQERLLRVAGGSGTASVAWLAGMRIPLPDGSSARLDELARVYDGVSDPTSLARVDGQEVVGFSIERSKGASEIAVAEGVQKALDQISADHREVTFRLESDNVTPTRESFSGAISSLLEGTALAVLVVGLFLRNWRATAIAATAIPLSVIPTFAVMQLLGFSLNGMSLMAISLVAGILVDDAIVMIEAIERKQQSGLSPYRAAIVASRHIGMAVMATTMVIVVVFLPVAGMPGIAGKYFVEFGITVAVAVLMSLLVARLITPVLAAYVLRDPRHQASEGDGGTRWFRRLLHLVMRHRRITLVTGVLVLACSMALAPFIPTGFYAMGDRSLSTLQVRMAPGTTLADAERRVADLTAMIREQSEVKSVFARIAVPDSRLTVTLVPVAERSLSTRAWQARIRPLLAGIPDQRSQFLTEMGTRDVTLSLRGDDPEALMTARDALATGLRALPAFAEVTANDLVQPETVVTPRVADAAAVGISALDLANTLRWTTQGDDAQNLARVSIDGRQIPVRVLADPALRQNPILMAAVTVPRTDGSSVPLLAVADIGYGSSPATINRVARTRQVTIEADLQPGFAVGEALSLAAELPAYRNLPPGVHVVSEGDAELMGELFIDFAVAMVLGLLSMYLVLVLLYRDVFQPITIIVSLPLALGGAFVALLATGSALDLAALIGVLTLLGIVAKNAILVVDDAQHRHQAGAGPRVAAIAAARTRARPIIMTTLAMIAGMAPVLFGVTTDAAFRVPMAWVVIGGLLSSTLLSLVFVPALYVTIDWMRRSIGRIAIRLIRVPTATDLEDRS